MDFINKDPFAWPYKDSIANQYQSEDFEDQLSETSVPKLAESTDDPLSIKDSQHILDDIFNSLLGEKGQNSTTQDPLLKDLATMLETNASSTENAIITEKESSFETVPSDMKYEVSQNSFSSVVENITKLFENDSESRDESFYTQNPADISDGISSEVRSESSFYSTFNRLTQILDRSTTEMTELPVFETTKTTTMTDLANTNDPTYGLNSAVNIDLIDLPMKTHSEALEQVNNLKDVLRSMQTTKIDPAIMEPIHNPEPISFIPETSDFFQSSSVTTETPFFKGTIMENPITINKTSKANFEDLIANATEQVLTTTETDTTTLTSEFTEDFSEFTSAVSEITTAASEQVKSVVSKMVTAASETITTAGETEMNEITLVFNEITTDKPAINETTSNIFINATNEIISITTNATFQPNDFKNVTGGVIADEDINSWVFYVILATTVFILLMVIGGVFLFYKKIKPRKGAGYQVSHMKEYSSSTASENDTNNDKV